MNKTQLIDSVAIAADLPKTVASKALDAVLDSITQALQSGEQVSLVGFGTFSVKHRAARTGRNPKTGKMIEIPETYVANFKPGKVLKDSVSSAALADSELVEEVS